MFFTNRETKHKYLVHFSLTHMASFALFPSIASVLTLKSTPEETDQQTIKRSGFKESTLTMALNSFQSFEQMLWYVCMTYCCRLLWIKSIFCEPQEETVGESKDNMEMSRAHSTIGFCEWTNSSLRHFLWKLQYQRLTTTKKGLTVDGTTVEKKRSYQLLPDVRPKASWGKPSGAASC